MTQIDLPVLGKIVKRPFFYRDKRVLFSFLVSLPIAYFGDFFAAIFMHLSVGVLVDWWFFQFKKVKESDVTPIGWLDRVGITKEDLDTHSTVYMWLRHGAFFVSCMAVLADMFFKFGINFAVTFGSAYYFFRFFSGFYLAYKKMMYPWVGAKLKNISTVSPLGKVIDMTDPSNGYGFYNPISPNYIFKRD